jgi:hypothetical protein
MRKKARKILFEELEKSGWQWVVFNEDNPDKNNGIVECILDAMQKFKPCNEAKKILPIEPKESNYDQQRNQQTANLLNKNVFKPFE